MQITSLQSEQKPIRFTDSPTHYAHPSSSSGYGHSAQPLSGTSGLGTNFTSTQPPTPSPRRTSSSTSDHLADLYHNYRENFQPSPSQDRDYYYRADPSYTTYDRTADYVVKHPYFGYDEGSFEYREPTPDYRPTTYLTHRRTPSNSSASNSHVEEFSPSRQAPKYKDRREDYRSKTEYPRKTSDYSLPRDFYRQESQDKEVERPANLGLELGTTKLRSSLKKYNKKTSASGGSSGGGTPTNPTPPDSLTSETDSSYVSARDASSGSQSRVRFSPETMEGPVVERRPSRHT